MLVSPGRNVRHSDMQLLESVKMCQQQHHWAIQVRGTESFTSTLILLESLLITRHINELAFLWGESQIRLQNRKEN